MVREAIYYLAKSRSSRATKGKWLAEFFRLLSSMNFKNGPNLNRTKLNWVKKRVKSNFEESKTETGQKTNQGKDRIKFWSKSKTKIQVKSTISSQKLKFKLTTEIQVKNSNSSQKLKFLSNTEIQVKKLKFKSKPQFQVKTWNSCLNKNPVKNWLGSKIEISQKLKF